MRLGHLLALSTAFALFACSDAATGSDPEQDPEAGTLGDALVPQTDATQPPPPVVGARELQIIGERNRLVFHGALAELTVKYVGADSNGQPQPIPNSRVTASMIDENGRDASATGVEGSILRAGSANTNAQGEATFQLTAGMRDAQFRIQASAQDAEPVTFQVTVAREGAGGLTVRVQYDTEGGRYQFQHLQAAKVSLFDRINCDLLRQSAADLQGAYFAAAPIQPFNEVDNSVTVGDLDDGARFSVAAVGTNAMDNTVTFGCADGVTIVGGRVVDVEIELTDLPLEFKGTYTMRHEFNLTDLLRSSENSALNTVADVLDILRLIGDDSGARGAAIVDQLCDLASIGDGLCDVLRALGGRLIDEAIDRFVPPNVLAVFEAISDIISIFSELTVLGEFQMNSLNADNRIEGNDNRWQKFEFTWRLNCPDDMDCTQEFALGDLAINDRPIFGTFNAELDGPQLFIETHGITFRYGLIILGIATNWVIPAITGANGPVTVEEMIATLVPCDEINDFLTGDPRDGLCERVLVAALAEVLVNQLSRLEFSAEQFTIRGEVTPVDENGDLTIDRLEMGIWNGNIDAGDLQLEFNGCFEGCRPENGQDCEPEDCIIPPLMED